ncbi:YdjY domain-containing protein [Limnoglobus roseus]|uniref:Uncharacterized protein n=1 Tax=Limnoglobus roseus TaxID=2598579 RepID=A0A5C1A665_9BACT|nr:YdjY domain-containing protein [Limnoglobus roseus]QEL14641.1 hypothetical protein PX52LOC_01533 [Limnoglobus roseus]
MRHAIASTAAFAALAVFTPVATAADPLLPKPGQVVVDVDRGDVILSADVQIPKGKACIDAYGERIQAFVGTVRADGRSAKMAEYFVFLVDAPAEDVHAGMTKVGCKPKAHMSMADGKERSGWAPAGGPAFLDGDPVALSVFWKQGEKWVERPYESFVTERVMVDGKPVEKPWTPHFVYHGSGAIHKSGTGCIACPCDCPGGLIADNRNPIYDPKPTVKFDTSKAPPTGTAVYIRLRPTVTRE